ncbi:Poly [ADP-ribose] polymerase 12 [Anabarilius grahami]|uniref:Poly [ADP-ribose] polymerase 12 n=1 Tax=Anabarilius grahami TaxID=495550 RepID=A0A3N0YLZ5_ANAGA|nr:Poly [ADP-ribose] polymerase 12 [Anabarilius grahami]
MTEIMAEETLLKVLCGNHGAMDYERLLDISFGLTEISPQNSLDKILRRSDIFTVIQRNQSKEVFAQTNVELCRKTTCDELCENLHLCKYELMMGRCSRHGCSFGHQLLSEHNARILRARHMIRLSREDLRVILLQSDNSLLPPVCVMFNRGRGPHGNCPDGEKCTRLHVCVNFIRGRCDGTDCGRSHDFHEPRLKKVLYSRGVSHQLMDSLPFIYRNILALKTPAERRNTEPVRSRRIVPETNAENEICLSFVRGFCGDDECSRTHFKMPYKWEVKVARTWHDLPNSEQIERDYCDPSNIHSSGNEPICFEEMTLGLDEVRRLSTESSALLPGFVLATSWIWYWKNEYNRWIQYSSVVEMHRLSSVSSEQLEQKYQEYLLQNQEDAGVKFNAGHRFYELCFTDMKQQNEVSGTERPVRRRPAFVSSVDVQRARARCCGASKAHFSKGVPGFWDQTAIPDSGFQRVRLPPSHRDYVRVQERFSETLRGFTVRQIERVQNRELWEDFMIKKEQMKIANKNEKYSERLLFHGTRSSLVDEVCHRNFDFQEFDASAYGKGIYFSKDARYWDERTDGFAVRLMFACRVLVGYYARGAARFRHPPARNAEGSLYDSCVDDPRHPSVFVVFDRSQIYPEFLITYEENSKFEVVRSGVSACDVSFAQVNVKETSQTSRATEPEQTSVWASCTSSLRITPTTGSASALKGPDSDPEHTSSSRGGTDSLITVLGSTLDTTVGVSTACPVSAEHIFTAFPVSAQNTPTALPVSAQNTPTALPVSAQNTPTAFPVSAQNTPTAFPVSAQNTPTAFPVSAQNTPTALPVSAQNTPTALPVSAQNTPTALPVSAQNTPTAFPVSAQNTPTALPVSAQNTPTAFPVSAQNTPTALPVSAQNTPTAFPVSAQNTPTALPVSAQNTPTAFPVSAQNTPTALPVSAQNTPTAFPVSAQNTPTALPVSAQNTPTAFPVSAQNTPTALPVSAQNTPTAFPVSAQNTPTALPVSAQNTPTAFPVSAQNTPTAFPVSAERVSTAFPVSAQNTPTAFPVSAECISTALPVSAERISTALPVSAEHVSTAFPVSSQNVSTAFPVSAERISTALPVSAERISTALPVSAEHVSTALPVSAEHVSTAFPVSAERISTALPVSAEHVSTALLVSAERVSTALSMYAHPLQKYPVKTEDLSMTRSSGSMSSSSTLSSLPHDHTGNSPGGTNPHKPAAEKKKCAVM